MLIHDNLPESDYIQGFNKTLIQDYKTQKIRRVETVLSAIQLAELTTNTLTNNASRDCNLLIKISPRIFFILIKNILGALII